MSHSTVLVVIKGASSAADAEDMLGPLLEPFDENAEVEPFFRESSEEAVKHAVDYYKKSPELCTLDNDAAPARPFEEFATTAELEIEWTRQAIGCYERDSRDAGVYQDGVFGYMSTYNPDSKWDWWSLGGRWHGFFQLKPKVSVGGEPLPEWRQALGVVGKEEGRIDGVTTVETFDGTHDAILGMAGTFGDPAEENFEGRADLARKGDIDFEAMRTLAAQRADAAYDKFEQATKDVPVATPFQEVLRKTFFDNNMDPDATVPDDATEEEAKQWHEWHGAVVNEARTTYHGQPWIKALREGELEGSIFEEPIEYWCVHTGGRDAFVKRAYDGATGTFAVLIDGNWHEKGEMGWWGFVSGEKDQGVWAQEQRKLIDGLDDDVYLAVVDVHI